MRLTPRQGLGLALILHELATSASKYGALSTEVGKLLVSWGTAPAGAQRDIRLTWQERGGPPVVDGNPRGFGTKLIEQACEYELGGAAELRLEPEGLTAEIAFPASEGD